MVLVELVFICSDCIRVVGIRSRRSLCQLALHWFLHLMLCEILPRSYHVLLYSSLPVEGRQCAGVVFGDWGDTLHKCQVVMSFESELRNYLSCVPLSLHAQGFELNPCFKAETRSSAVLPLPAKARYAEKVALLFYFFFHRKFLAVENANWASLPCSVLGWLSDLHVRPC